MRRKRDIAAACSIHSEKEKGQLVVFIVRRKRDIAVACSIHSGKEKGQHSSW